MRSKIILSIACFALTGCLGVLNPQASQSLAIHTDRRSTSSMLMDSSLELELNAQVQSLDLPTNSRVSVKIFNRHALVLGQVPDESYIEQIEALIAKTEGVKKIYNEIIPSPALTSWQQAKDGWITTKITSSMILTPQINPWKIHITTENGVVYMVGIVTPAEESFAVDIAKTTSGVRKVVKIFEYKKTNP
jgi:osmotically-inducible protein OsmY